ADFYDCWAAHGDDGIYVREIAAVLNRIRGDGPRSCTLAGSCLGRYYLIEPNGDIAHCDLFVGDANYTFGNVLTDSFDHIRQSANLRALQLANARALQSMSTCPEFSTCNGWCPHERYLSLRHNPDYSPACCGLLGLIRHIRQRSLHSPEPSQVS